MGNLDTHDHVCRFLCKFSNFVIISINYRLAPENKFPVGSNDSKHIFKNLKTIPIDFLDLSNILIRADSAGGNIATVLSINCSKKEIPNIKGQFLIYPCVDLTLSMKSINFNLNGLIFTGETMKYFENHYLKNKTEANNIEASPLFIPDLRNQLATFIYAAELDPFLDEGLAYKNRLLSFGIKVKYKLYKEQLHGFVTNLKHFPLALECLKQISLDAKDLVGK